MGEEVYHYYPYKIYIIVDITVDDARLLLRLLGFLRMTDVFRKTKLRQCIIEAWIR